jgi:GH43 family beta-xylosidase
MVIFIMIVERNNTMKSVQAIQLAMGLVLCFAANSALAQNPIIRDQFTADPTARVFGDRVYLFPSHDIPAPAGFARQNWFCMEDYHVFSSDNLTDWTDHGVIVTQSKVPWLTRLSYDMWAPDCVTRNGKYYFYFPVAGQIGVAIADKPEGPYTVMDHPFPGARGIDPVVFFDTEGNAYLVTSGGFRFVKMKENMVEPDGEPVTIRPDSPIQSGLIEGPFVFQRKGKYYLTYPHAVNTAGFQSENLEYCMADSPLGPYTYKGLVMDQSDSHCWTNHHSFIEWKGEWYLFYHDKDYSPNFDKNRSAKIDRVTFNEDGTINNVIPTHRGVGVSKATTKIQIDRFSEVVGGKTFPPFSDLDMGQRPASATSDQIGISFLNPQKTFDGWKTTFKDKGAWIRYNWVDFGKGLKTVNLQAKSETGGTLEIRVDKLDSAPIATVIIDKLADWKAVSAKLGTVPEGQHDLIVTMPDKNDIEVDWVSFE